MSADASWRRALTPRLDGWARAGAGLLYTDEPLTPARRDLLPVVGAGLALAGDRGHLGGELSANLTSVLDRFRGEVRPAMDTRLALSWPAAERVSVTGQAAGGRRIDGETLVASADLRVAWTVRPGVALTGGALWRLQRERRPELPSFSETGVIVGLQYTAGRR
jgi:hypothetical protein